MDVDTVSLRVAHGVRFDQILARIARQYPARLAMADGYREITFAELDDRVTRLAAAMQDLGVVEGDRVVIFASNRVELIESLYATARLGAIAVPLSFRYVTDELAYALADCEPRLIIVQSSLEQQVRSAIGGQGVREVLVFDGQPDSSFEQAIAHAGSDGSLLREVDLDASEPFVLLYTSGTTGRPKGVLLDHLSCYLKGVFRAQEQKLGAGDEVAFIGLQLFHSGGLGPALMTHALGGSLIVAGFESPSTAQIVDFLERYEVTMCSLVPTQWQRLVEFEGIESRRFALRRISWGASPAADPLLVRLNQVFGTLPIASLYGQTETAGCTFVIESRSALQLGAIGRPLPNVEVRVVDEHMNDVAPGAVGELVYRGPSVMIGYWRNDQADLEAFAGGWFHSGDLVRVDGDGCYWVAGRIKEMIISGGENIFPAELERVIMLHPGVREVAVVGRPHERWGETPVAFIVPMQTDAPPTEAEIIQLCRENVASFKKPSAVVIVHDLPRNAIGKVQRFLLEPTS